MPNPLLENLAGRLLFEADLEHDWADTYDAEGSYSSACRLCNESENATGNGATGLCEKRIQELMVRCATEAHQRGILNVR
jgi:hypothetical protein